MAMVFPFRGILYNKEKVDDLSLVTAPPYDVISEEEQDKYYKMHKFNIIRLILGKERPTDSPLNNRYTRAANFLNNWLNQKILIQDSEPSIYLYTQEYELEGERRIQKGIICNLRLEEFSTQGTVLPHEETLQEHKDDRLRLLEACEANLSPIFCLYSDPEFRLFELMNKHTKQPPIINIRNENKTRNKLWKVSSTDTIMRIQEILLHKKIYIADGHHRYETALLYRNKRNRKGKISTGDKPYNHIITYFVNMDDPDLTILPAHRLIRRISNTGIANYQKQIDKFFIRRDCSSCEQLSKLLKNYRSKGGAFGIYDGVRLEFLILRDRLKCEEILPHGKPEIYKSLDVTILHRLLLNHILGEGKEMNKDNIVYVKDMTNAFQLVCEKKFSLAIIVNPTKVTQVKEIASIGVKMPGKATYFYPKPLSGLVIHKFNVP